MVPTVMIPMIKPYAPESLQWCKKNYEVNSLGKSNNTEANIWGIIGMY